MQAHIFSFLHDHYIQIYIKLSPGRGGDERLKGEETT